MDNVIGAQYAVFMAMQTLKNRCSQLQQRVLDLEEENINLRLQGFKPEPIQTYTLNQYDQLRVQVTELTEQKEHLTHKINLVKNENEEVWSRLKQLSNVNQDLGEKLKKLTMSINDYAAKKAHSPLIRSKTFTQDEPQTRILQQKKEETEIYLEKTCAELEEISLKIISQTKVEMDSFLQEVNGETCCFDNIISDSCGFYYDELNNDIIEEFNELSEELKLTKSIVETQKISLQKALNQLVILQANNNKVNVDKLSLPKEMVDNGTETMSEHSLSPISSKIIMNTLENQLIQEDSHVTEVDKYCPVCSNFFSESVSFIEFIQHVEIHFKDEGV